MLQRLLAVAILTAVLSSSAFLHAADAPGKRSRARYYFRLDSRVAGGLSGCPTKREVSDIFPGELGHDTIRDDDTGLIVVDLSRKGGTVQAAMALDGAAIPALRAQSWSASGLCRLSFSRRIRGSCRSSRPGTIEKFSSRMTVIRLADNLSLERGLFRQQN